jgi:MFS family permease
LSAFSKIIFSLAYSWPVVLLARFVDRFGKGTRTSARDALITESSDSSARGRTFGFHRAMDTMGAVIGPLLAIVAMQILNENYRFIFLLSFIPAFIGVLLLFFFVKEKDRKSKSTADFQFNWKSLDPSFKVFLFISFIFALGNSSNAFLILRAQNLGLSVTMVMLAYVLFNFVYAVFSLPAGIISDKIGPKKILLAGFLLFAVIYLFFGLITKSIFIWLLFPFYGIYMALTEGIGKAYISNLIPKEKAGTAFGIYQTTIGLCTFFASWIAGLLWSYVSISAPFIFGSVMAMLAALLFYVFGKR